MLGWIRQKQSYRFVLVMGLLVAAAGCAIVVSEMASRAGNWWLGALAARVAIGLAVSIVFGVGLKLARSASLHSEYSLQVTNPGLVFSALILLVAILSLSSGNNLLYLFLSVLLATMFVSLVGARLSLSRLRVEPRFPERVFVGEPVSFEIAVTNGKRLLPAFSVGIATVEPGEAGAEEPRVSELCYLPVIPAKTEAIARPVRVYAKRGIYPMRGVMLATRFPLGFIEQRRMVEAEGELVVYPAPGGADRLEVMLRQAQGRIEGRGKGMGSDLHAIRQYQPSDHHHHIDWKATAKTGGLMVREFTRDDDWRVTVIFDPVVDAAHLAEDEFAERFERAIAVAAGLLKRLIEAGAEVRLVCGDADSGYGEGPSQLHVVLRQLAETWPVAEAPEGVASLPEDATESSRILFSSRARAAADLQAIGFDEV